MRYLVVKNIGELVTMKGSNGLRTGKAMNEVHFCMMLIWLRKTESLSRQEPVWVIRNIAMMLLSLMPTKSWLLRLIDSHTHLVHAGSREHELAMKLAGYSYLEILKQGGGILNTVNHTVKASFDELVDQAQKTLNRMLLHGTTVVEAKSGYGLELSTEVKQLEVARFLDQKHPVKIVNTFMGAHAIPPQYQNDRPKFLALLKEMTEEVKTKFSRVCDAFCRRVFRTKQRKYNLCQIIGRNKMHADEIVPMGAALAQELGCISADHLMATTESDMERLAQSGTVANLLPLTSFYLNSDYAKARLMIEKGCGVAIATDYNPGSSPCENLQLAMQVACLKMKMTPKEVITAATINAAVSLGLEKTKVQSERKRC